MLHGGDNDTTGTICGAFFGVLQGFKGVPEINYNKCEDYILLMNLG